MRRLPRTIDKPIELIGFRMEEVLLFAGALVLFLIFNWFFTGLIMSALLLAFMRLTRQGGAEGHIMHLLYRATGLPLGKLLPARLKKLSG